MSTNRAMRSTRKKNVWEEISGGNDVIIWASARSTRAPIPAPSTSRGRPAEKVGQLSGGERNRVHLAKMLKTAPTCCSSTSRPTISTSIRLRAWKEALMDFAGCAVHHQSHDRFFLDRIATHMLAFEGDSHVEWFEGNFADYEEDKKRRLGIDG